MPVADELARGEHRRHYLHAIHPRIEPALQQADQVFRRIAAAAHRLFIEAAELLFGDVAVIALELLLGVKLHAVVRHLAAARLAVLAGAVFAPAEGALGPPPQIAHQAAVDLVLRLQSFAHNSSRVGVVVPIVRPGPCRRRGGSPAFSGMAAEYIDWHRVVKRCIQGFFR